MRGVSSGECILFLWQNAHTVVIGRNQNPWKECCVARLEEEGGKLARRLSGGGAVYHDLGNLNFTFLAAEEDYHVTRQLSVIVEACRRVGVPAEISGRNDVLARDKKFSGNAFYKSGGKCCHHGTLMVDVDLERVGRYLTPSRAKLQAKGVDSVRARVVNLRHLSPGLTCREMADRMVEAFQAVYGRPAARLSEAALDQSAIAPLAGRNAGWEWLYGQDLPFHLSWEGSFPWGGAELCLAVKKGRVASVRLYSDAMDWTLSPTLEAALAGVPFVRKDLLQALSAAPLEPNIRQDLMDLLEKQEMIV